MSAMLEDRPVSEQVIASYLVEVNQLRTDDEKARQKEILGGQ